MANATKGANAGQFKKSSPRFIEYRRWHKYTIHALVYDREQRMWSTICEGAGLFPRGRWIASWEKQPEVTCKKCATR